MRHSRAIYLPTFLLAPLATALMSTRAWANGAVSSAGSGAAAVGIEGHVLFGGALAGTIVFIAVLRKMAARRRSLHVRGNELLRDARRTLRLSRRQLRQLTLAARQARVSSPLTLLLCPSLLRQARGRMGHADGRELDALLRRMSPSRHGGQ